MNDAEYQEFIERVHVAEEWQYLVVQSDGMARKSDLDAWLMERYGVSEMDARNISNQTTEGLRGERRPFYTQTTGAVWQADRPAPTWTLAKEWIKQTRL